MNPTEFSIDAPYGEQLYAWRLTPASPPIGVVCLVHGFGEHSMRYLHWGQRFCDNDYAFVAFDLVGHGKTSGKRGVVKSFDQYLDELGAVLCTVGELYPGLPLILYGHSMGGLIAINYVIKRCCMASLLVATSPWIRLTKPPVLPLRLLLKILEKVHPNMQLPSNINPKHICHIEEEVKKYRTDPLNHGVITPRLYQQVNMAGQFALTKSKRITIPILLMHGQSDPITSFNATSELASQVENCSFIPWRGMYHELHNETVANTMFQILKEWISGNIEEAD